MERRPDVVLLDIMLPEGSGLEAVQKIQARDPKLPIIFITAGGTSDTTIEAMKLGAYDYLLKPLDLPKLRDLVERALEIRRLMQVRVEIPTSEAPSPDGDQIIGRSPAMCEVFKAIGRVAPQNVTTLIMGESGTGKELVARAIYHHSVRVLRAVFGPQLCRVARVASGKRAVRTRKGLVHQRQLPPHRQVRAVREGDDLSGRGGRHVPVVAKQDPPRLQDKRFERVGGNETIETDVRVIAATNRDLKEMVAKGTFREDLYYRLNGFTIKLPPLRERGEDILFLLEHLLSKFARELQQAGRPRHLAGGAGGPDALHLAGERAGAGGGGASVAAQHDGERDPARLSARPGATGKPETPRRRPRRPTRRPATCGPSWTTACVATRRTCTRPAWR